MQSAGPDPTARALLALGRLGFTNPKAIGGKGAALSHEKIPIALQRELPMQEICNGVLQQASAAKLGIEVNAHQDADLGIVSKLVYLSVQPVLSYREFCVGHVVRPCQCFTPSI
jgi:hypothetical protein